MSKNPKPNPTTSKIDGVGKRLTNYISLLITGTGIGWLVGLSVSPVISIVIKKPKSSTHSLSSECRQRAWQR